ncbi:MAG: substrate binding transporter, partial [Acidimicrobiaceae bacterium]|nr:substrate binding transporter [Acidimicrobiaceae bacterium]
MPRPRQGVTTVPYSRTSGLLAEVKLAPAKQSGGGRGMKGGLCMSKSTKNGARRLRKGAIVLATGSVTLGLAAAGTGIAAASSGRASGTKYHGSMTIMGFGTNGDDVATSRFAIAKRAVSGATVNAPNGSFSDQAFLSDLAAGKAPDLVYMSNYQIGTYAAKGALMPMTSCIQNQGINMNTFTAGARAMVTLNGTVYGLPEFTDDRTVIVNDSVVSKAGLTPASLSTTNWQKLSQVAKKLTVMKSGKLQTIGFDPKLPEFFPLWVKANGGAILSSNGLKAELNSPQDVQALTYAVS